MTIDRLYKNKGTYQKNQDAIGELEKEIKQAFPPGHVVRQQLDAVLRKRSAIPCDRIKVLITALNKSNRKDLGKKVANMRRKVTRQLAKELIKERAPVTYKKPTPQAHYRAKPGQKGLLPPIFKKEPFYQAFREIVDALCREIEAAEDAPEEAQKIARAIRKNEDIILLGEMKKMGLALKSARCGALGKRVIDLRRAMRDAGGLGENKKKAD